MIDIDEIVRPHLKNLKPYASARDDYAGDEGVFLDANENPFGSVGGGSWNRYPDPHQIALKDRISSLKEIDPQNIFIGNGSDEPIDLLIRAFCEPGKDSILICPPTYGMYEVSAGVHNVETRKVLLTSRFQLDVEAIKEEMGNTTKLVFICSPNNPTGNNFDRDDILHVAEKSRGLVVVDEAYVDFTPESSLLKCISEFNNMVVLQTFSKAWGLAGLRLGAAFADSGIIDYLNRIKPPYNISEPIQQKALKALAEASKQQNWIQEILGYKRKLVNELAAMDFVAHIYPSDANFLLVKFNDPKGLYAYLQSQKVIVRDRSGEPLCEGCLRITIGTPEENEKLISVLRSFKP